MSFRGQHSAINSHDSGFTCDTVGTLTTTSTSYREHDVNNLPQIQTTCHNAAVENSVTEQSPKQMGSFMVSTSEESKLLIYSGLSSCNLGNSTDGALDGMGLTVWESPTKPISLSPSQSRPRFTIPNCEPTIHTEIGTRIIGNTNASSADSLIPHSCSAAVSFVTPPCSFNNQLNFTDLLSMDKHSTTSYSNSFVPNIIPFPLGNSIWSPSTMVSAPSTSQLANFTGNVNKDAYKYSCDSQIRDENLVGLSKQDLLNFVKILKDKLDESTRSGNEDRCIQIKGAIVHVQNFIINSFVSESSSNSNSVTKPATITTTALSPRLNEKSFAPTVKLYSEIAGYIEAPYIWRGELPHRVHHNSSYSCKVFLGGLQWDITEGTLMQTFKPFGIVGIEWPGKEGVTAKPKGYAYAVFENENQVKLLLQSCTHDYNHYHRSGNYYYKISSTKYHGKDVQIIPWPLSDSNFKRCQDTKIDPLKTIFVGALHGMINAEGLATIMQDLFGGVVYAGIDCDRKKYPIGSARVAFSDTRSHMKAVTAAFVVIKTSRFEKKLQVDPYLEVASCSVCNLKPGPYFCRDSACFTYFCRTCFQFKHSEGQFRNHSIMTRTTHNKSQQQQQPDNVYSGPYNGNNGNHGYNNGGNHHQSYGYAYGDNSHLGNSYHGFGGNNRQWNGNTNNFGGNTPPLNTGNCGTGHGALLGMNVCNKNYNGGGQMNGGGGNSNNSNRQRHPNYFSPTGLLDRMDCVSNIN